MINFSSSALTFFRTLAPNKRSNTKTSPNTNKHPLRLQRNVIGSEDQPNRVETLQLRGISDVEDQGKAHLRRGHVPRLRRIVRGDRRPPLHLRGLRSTLRHPQPGRRPDQRGTPRGDARPGQRPPRLLRMVRTVSANAIADDCGPHCGTKDALTRHCRCCHAFSYGEADGCQRGWDDGCAWFDMAEHHAPESHELDSMAEADLARIDGLTFGPG